MGRTSKSESRIRLLTRVGYNPRGSDTESKPVRSSWSAPLGVLGTGEADGDSGKQQRDLNVEWNRKSDTPSGSFIVPRAEPKDESGVRSSLVRVASGW